MLWEDAGWDYQHVIKLPYVRYHHYAFCKGTERFKLKKDWWESRFERDFDYGWHIDQDGKIDDPNHEIKKYTGKHPAILEGHPLWQK